MHPGAYELNMAPPDCLRALDQTAALHSHPLYALRMSNSGHLLGFVRNKGLHGNGACSLVYPHSYYVMDKGYLLTVTWHGMTTSLLKWKGYLWEWANPDMAGLSKSQENMASNCSSAPCLLDMVLPLPKPLVTWGSP